MRVLIEGRLLDIGPGSKRKIRVDIKSLHTRRVKGFITGVQKYFIKIDGLKNQWLLLQRTDPQSQDKI